MENNRNINWGLACFAALFVWGCGGEHFHDDQGQSGDEGHEEETHASHFVEGKGVRLTEHGREVVGLDTVPVRPAEGMLQKSLSVTVYRHANEAGDPHEDIREGYAYASRILPADQLDSLELGTSVEGRFNDQVFRGGVVGVDRQLEALTGEVEVMVAWEDPEHVLNIGNSLTAIWQTARRADQQEWVEVPSGAILETARGSFAYASNGSYFFRTPVRIADRSADRVLLSDGLYEGDVVASAGVQNLYLIELEVINGGKGCAHAH
ncbi:MAG: hypothetical protein AAFY98_05460 [Verrucomicrobiota bacterium]